MLWKYYSQHTPVLLRMLDPTGLNASISSSKSFTIMDSASTNLKEHNCDCSSAECFAQFTILT